MSRMAISGQDDAPSASEYFLRTERLGFRPWSEADMDLAAGLWADPVVTQYIGGPFSLDQVRERLAREMATQRERGIQYWPIFVLATSEHIGCCGLRPYGVSERVYEIGCHLRREHWGCGYAQEASRAVIAYAFEVLGAASLVAGHNPANEASRRALLRLGFAYTHDEYYAPTGLYHPTYVLRALPGPG